MTGFGSLIEKENIMFTEKKRTKFFALPICFTTYTITEDKLTIKHGLFTQVVDETYMYKIQDVRLLRGMIERLFGLGTVVCYTGDITHPELKLVHIKNSTNIKDFIMDTAEEARRKRRVLNTIGIDAPNFDVDNLD